MSAHNLALALIVLMFASFIFGLGGVCIWTALPAKAAKAKAGKTWMIYENPADQRFDDEVTLD